MSLIALVNMILKIRILIEHQNRWFFKIHVFTAAKIGEMNWLETVMAALKEDQLD